MDEQEWQRLVTRLEPLARSNPRAYRRRIIGLAALGYATVAAVLAALFALAAGLVVLGLHNGALALRWLIPIGVFIATVGKAFYVKIEPPAGLALNRGEVPELFRMIGEVREVVGGPRVHAVLLDGHANASIVQLPRAGGVLGSRSYLVVGYPYLAALSQDELRSVVGHELGHLSHRHGRFGAFVHRVRARWTSLLAALDAKGSSWAGLARLFVGWYSPIFDAYAFPVTRAHEFEADEAAAAVSGRAVAASALVSGAMGARWVGWYFWSSVFSRAADEPAPPSGVYARLAAEIALAKHDPSIEVCYRDELAGETAAADSHPSIGERLAHLGVEADEALALSRSAPLPSAAAGFLGQAEPRLVAALDEDWRNVMAESWTERHAEAVTEKADLAALDQGGSLSEEQRTRRAQLTERYRGAAAARPLYEELLGTESDALARFSIGRILLEGDDDGGLRWIDEAMECDPDAIVPGCELAHAYLHAHGRDEEAEAYRLRWVERSGLLEEARAERSEVSIDDKLERPWLPDEDLVELRDLLAAHEEVGTAYLVRKRVRHFDDTQPFHVLAVVPVSRKRTERKDRETGSLLAERVAREIALDLELIVVTLHEKSPIARHVAEVDGGLVYARNGHSRSAGRSTAARAPLRGGKVAGRSS